MKKLTLSTEQTVDDTYYVVRAQNAGVFAGKIISRNGQEVTMTECRRIWYWDGAYSLSQLAEDGTCKPENCKFSVPVAEILIFEVIEIITCSEKAEHSIRNVPLWS